MKKLIIFGDSFSTNFTTNDSVPVENGWPELLSKQLNIQLINHAIIGASNGEIINKFFEKYEDIDSNSIVIFQIGFFSSRILEHFSGKTIQIGYDYTEEKKFSIEDIQYYNKKVFNLDKYIYSDILKIEFICNYLQKLGISFLIWSLDDIIDNISTPSAFNLFHNKLCIKFLKNFLFFGYTHSMMNDIILKRPEFWALKNDWHFNTAGHQYFYNLVCEKLKI